MTDTQKLEVERLYTAGIGYASIANKLRLPSHWIKKHLQAKGMLRTRSEGFKKRNELGAFNEKVDV